ITDDYMGFSLSGPASREILERLAHDDVSNDAFPFLGVRELDVGTMRATVGRISLTGELGYEIVVPTVAHRTLLDELREAGRDDGIWIGERRVGFVTSGAYGHHVGKSLVLAYLDRDVIESNPEVTVFVVGDPRTARILPELPYDPKGDKLRDRSAIAEPIAP